MEDKIKNKLLEDLQGNKELKNTLNLEGTEYNVNAVIAEVAKRVKANLALEPSIGDRDDLTDDYSGNFDGYEDKAIKYVPSDGGKFTGPVQINEDITSVTDVGVNDIINYGQIETVISQLDGAPLYTWDVDTKDTGYNAIVNTGSNIPYKLNTVIGSIADLPVFEAYSAGVAHNLYVTPDSYDNAYITYGDTWHDAYWNEAYNDIKNTITKLVFKGVDASNEPIKIRGDSFYNMRGLTSIHLNHGVYELGTRAFSGCASLSYIAMPDSMMTVGAEAFMGCEALTSIILGSKVTEIKTATFKNCKSLKSIVVCNRNITKIASDAFSGCENLTKIYFNGTKAEWDAISGNPIPSNINRTVIPIDGTAFPFLYICKEADIQDTSLTSNKIFLKLPGKALVEISKGAARLERRDSKPTNNTDYFTYDVLAAVIAGINSRLTALGSSKLALPTTLKVSDTEHTAVPDLSEDIVATEEDKAIIVKDTIVPSVLDLAQDIEELETGLLDGVAGNYTSNTVGGIAANTQINKNITVSGLLKLILGIKEGVAPSGFTFDIYIEGSKNSTITAPLDQTSQTISAKWSVSQGTYSDEFTPKIGGVSGTPTMSTGGTISNISVSFTGSDVSKSISGSLAHNDGTGFTGNTLTASKSLTIQRTCYYGPANGTLSTTNRTSKTNWNIKTSSTINNDYFVFQYPKAWGKLSSVTDNDTSYEALTNSETFDNTPTEVIKNGGTYYQYKTNKPQNGNLNFTTKS